MQTYALLHRETQSQRVASFLWPKAWAAADWLDSAPNPLCSFSDSELTRCVSTWHHPLHPLQGDFVSPSIIHSIEASSSPLPCFSHGNKTKLHPRQQLLSPLHLQTPPNHKSFPQLLPNLIPLLGPFPPGICLTILLCFLKWLKASLTVKGKGGHLSDTTSTLCAALCVCLLMACAALGLTPGLGAPEPVGVWGRWQSQRVN